MGIIQINLWSCENCNHKENTVLLDLTPYSDPVISPPNNLEWKYLEVNGKELLCCPECVSKLTRD